MWLRFAFYMIFSLLAAPFESWSFFFNGLGTSDAKLIWYPLTHGLLYVLAIILIAESIFRLVHHWNFTKKHFGMMLLLFLSVFIEIFITFFYSMGERIRIINQQTLIDDDGTIQIALVAYSLFVAWISFFFIEYKHGKIAEPTHDVP